MFEILLDRIDLAIVANRCTSTDLLPLIHSIQGPSHSISQKSSSLADFSSGRSTNNGKTYNRNNNFNNQPHQNNAPYQPAPAHRMPPPYNNDFDRFGPPPFSGPPPPRGDVPYGRYPRDDYRPLPPPPPPPQMNPYPDPRYATGEYDRYGPPPPRGPPQGYSLQRDRAYDPYYDTPTNRDYSVYGSTPAYGVPPPPPSSHADGRPLYNSLPPPTAAAYGAPLESYYDYSTASAGTPSSNVRPQEGMGMGYVPMREGYEQQQRAGSFGAGDRYDPRGPAGREGRGERAGVRYTPYGRPERAAEGDSYRSPRYVSSLPLPSSPHTDS